MVTASDYGDAEHYDMTATDMIQEELRHRAYLRSVGQLEAYEAQQQEIINQGRIATQYLDQRRLQRQGMDFEETGSQADLWEWEEEP